ncbi:MJ1255/VC2487 family glycosyltransferase [uncultured Methanobrevibacter sp.]|uniref:MJ1255/VC2487 family glycosyltransferase n=1 Tax=uncultured Methanobrevibacter sp. TaxID=253161 RepID=UPI0025CC68FB|nr:MJ1255/VC2487 family glycosyltransferase [uncultured Methanobrevibacter sp.]
MKISIIIPTYNEEKSLPGLLQSIKSQDFTDYEIIIADANSTDKTKDIAKSYGCRVVEGGLPAKGRNNGARYAKGNLFLFLDADLKLSKDYFENTLNEFYAKNLDIAISQMIPESDKPSDKLLHDFANKFMVFVENIKPHGAGCYGIIVKRDLHEKINGFDESLDFGEDTDYIERAAKISDFRVLRSSKVIVSTRRLEEEGVIHLIKTYGKSTFNDFRGKRTTADQLDYSFEHIQKNNSFTAKIKLNNYPIFAKSHYNYHSNPKAIARGSKINSIIHKANSPINSTGYKKIKKPKPIYLRHNSANTNFTNMNTNRNINRNTNSNTKNINTNNINANHNHIKINKNITNKCQKNNKSHSKLNNKNLPLKSKKIVFYCVCGEGMGHAIRSGVILEKLTKIYDVYIFSGDRAYKYLNDKFDNVYEIGVYNTVYENNSVNDLATFIQCMKSTPSDIKKSYNTLFKFARKLKPHIIVSDFENYSNIVSDLMHIPLISLDNIHMITEAKIDFPPEHQADFLKAATIVKLYVHYAKIHILTSFFNPPIRKGRNSVIYPPILREDILNLKSEKHNHVLVYQTSNSNYELIEKLKNINEKFIVYGFNIDKKDKNLIFREFNEDIFYDDLRTAKAVITNGGFTLISEAIYLKKPIYSMPALGNFEQILNGYYVDKLSYGEYHEDMDAEKIINFLNNLDKYQKSLDARKNTDNSAIFEQLVSSIEKYSRKQ